MNLEMAFMLIGGLGFFLFGIKAMSEGLRKVSSERLKGIVAYLTRKKFAAMVVGAGVTALIQSSSAMTVMVVGFVNAGLMTLKQAIPVVLGANIGTTFTAWLVSFLAVFKITHYALPAVGIGFLFMLIERKPSLRQWGEVLFGFGVLFVGIGFMKDAFEPLESSERIMEIMVNFSRYPILGVLVGTVITMLLQSSSATIALVQLLALRGLIDFPAAIPIILGDNIGTTITAQIATIGGSTGAKRVAWAHTLFNVFGTIYMMFLVYPGIYRRFIEWAVPGTVTDKNIMFHIALSHSAFNVFNAFVFLPITSVLQKVVEKLIPEKGDVVSIEPKFLDRFLLDTPVLALDQSRLEIIRMLGLAESALRSAFRYFSKGTHQSAKRVERREEAVDNLQAEITRYLISISMENLEHEEAEMIPVFIHCVNDIERIADHAENIVELGARRLEKKLDLSESATRELKEMYDLSMEMVEDVMKGLQTSDVTFAKRALKKEDTINRMQIDLRNEHVKRLNEGQCKVYDGMIFLDCVDYLEKICDHLANISQGLLGGFRWE